MMSSYRETMGKSICGQQRAQGCEPGDCSCGVPSVPSPSGRHSLGPGPTGVTGTTLFSGGTGRASVAFVVQSLLPHGLCSPELPWGTHASPTAHRPLRQGSPPQHAHRSACSSVCGMCACAPHLVLGARKDNPPTFRIHRSGVPKDARVCAGNQEYRHTVLQPLSTMPGHSTWQMELCEAGKWKTLWSELFCDMFL